MMRHMYTDKELDRLRRCSDTGKPLFSMERMRALLESAHNPPEDRTGRRPSPDETARLEGAFESLFFQLPIERLVDYLSSASIEEVAAKLNLMTPADREDILRLISPCQRESVLDRLGVSA